MHSQIKTMLDEAEQRYLKSEELSVISQYVDSLPERLDAYRHLRDQELNMMQSVADQLQIQMPQEKVEDLERSIKNALLVLRTCGMGMLLNDESYIHNHLLNWLGQTMQVYQTKSIDTTLYRLLNQQLTQILTPKQMALLKPMLLLSLNTLMQPAPTTAQPSVV
jgi:Phycobilisome protein